ESATLVDDFDQARLVQAIHLAQVDENSRSHRIAFLMARTITAGVGILDVSVIVEKAVELYRGESFNDLFAAEFFQLLVYFRKKLRHSVFLNLHIVHPSH